jgi:selenocysteine lyase/cysteine desulfurase
MPRIYLDNAATSFPKPPGVYDAMLRYATEIGASPGRGQYHESREGARLIRQCRERLCRLINGEDPSHVVFALNTSDALNLAIKGVARRWKQTHPGRPMRIITTAMDHNSVLRPYRALEEDGAEVVHIDAAPDTGVVAPSAVCHAITEHTALVAVNMASNVGGTIQPAAKIGQVCRKFDVPYLVDAAQSLGHVPVDVQELRADLLAFPGHKGLMGPQGTGGLYIRPAMLPRLATTREGGTGSWSEDDAQPSSMPERFEAGSHNTAGLVGLSESVQWILDQGVASLREHELGLIRVVLDGLREGGCRGMGWEQPATSAGNGTDASALPLDGFRLLGPTDAAARVGVFALVHDSLDPGEMAAILEASFGILVRSGLTCAPGAHRTFGSLGKGGALRFSLGPFVTHEDVEALLGALRQIGAAHASTCH